MNAYYLFGLLEKQDVILLPDTRLFDVTDDHVIVERGVNRKGSSLTWLYLPWVTNRMEIMR